MVKKDLEHIKQTIREEIRNSVKEEVRISVKEVVDKAIKENNKIITKVIINDISKKIDESSFLIKQSLNEQDDRFDTQDIILKEIKGELALKPSKKHLFNYIDKVVEPIILDVDRLKYLNRKTWKSLPSQPEITKALVEAEVKEKK